MYVAKRRRLDEVELELPAATGRRQNPMRSTKTYLEGLEMKIKTSALQSSWLQRKDRRIQMPCATLNPIFTKLFMETRKALTGELRFRESPEIMALMEKAEEYKVTMKMIETAQRGREIFRDTIIHDTILPVNHQRLSKYLTFHLDYKYFWQTS